jgi:Fur family transcriptional regulator, peroxide stress response regulator
MILNKSILKLKNMGLKITPQRIAILEFLEGNKSHPSAKDIYESLKNKFPSLSLATIYNTVESMVKTSSLQELTITKERSNYDPDISEHDHSYCLKCGKIEDVRYDENLSGKTIGDDFTIMSVRKNYYGLCKKCIQDESS